jgi:acyl-coenzyme A synthetase/AMP-(fatty) acid ligase
MLYQRWTRISSEYRHHWALRDLASGKVWTFGELFDTGEATVGTLRCDVREFDGSATVPVAVSGVSPETPSTPIFPTGHSPQFIFQLLAAWRDGKPACPLESGQSPPEIGKVPPEIAHFKCTSATAGAARLVAFTGEQLTADADNIVATMGLRPDWPNVGVISLAHSYGFSNLVLPLLLHGIPLILAPAPLPEIIRRTGEGHEAVTIPAVPAMWRAWHQAGAIPKNVRLAISAGAPLPVKLEQEIFKASGLKIHNFLGASECGGIAYDATTMPRDDAALAGTAMRNVQLSLDGDGCLVVQSRAVGQTYWPEPESGSPRLGKGVFHSNDLAELGQGNVILRGRMGDLINVAGRKVSPETIERELLANPKVRECLVLGLPSQDSERMEIIAAVVVSDATEAELKKCMLDKLRAWQVPREWHFVDALQTNPRGKVSRAEWRKKLVCRAETK